MSLSYIWRLDKALASARCKGSRDGWFSARVFPVIATTFSRRSIAFFTWPLARYVIASSCCEASRERPNKDMELSTQDFNLKKFLLSPLKGANSKAVLPSLSFASMLAPHSRSGLMLGALPCVAARRSGERPSPSADSRLAPYHEESNHVYVTTQSSP